MFRYQTDRSAQNSRFVTVLNINVVLNGGLVSLYIVVRNESLIITLNKM